MISTSKLEVDEVCWKLRMLGIVACWKAGTAGGELTTLTVMQTQRFGVGYAATRSLNSAKPPVVNFAGKTTHAHASSPDIAKQMYTGLFKMLAIDVNGHPRTFSEYAGKVCATSLVPMYLTPAQVDSHVVSEPVHEPKTVTGYACCEY